MMQRKGNKSSSIFLFILFVLWPLSALSEQNVVYHSDPIAPVIFGVTSLLFFAIIGRYISRRLEQPTVLGELIIGIIISNVLYYFGVQFVLILREGPAIFHIIHLMLDGSTLEQSISSVLPNGVTAKRILNILQGPYGYSFLQVAQVVDGISRYGIIFMLFLVGLESSTEELRHSSGTSVRVALTGVIAPFAFGYIAASLFQPALSVNTKLFIGATLCATSVSISAAILRDLKQHKTSSAHVILGAAVIDDVLGLIVLSIVSGIVVSGSVQVIEIVRVISLASLFFIIIYFTAHYFLKIMVYLVRHLKIIEAKLFVSFLFVMILAWFANLVGLATIIGAFAGGLILHDGYFQHWGDVDKHPFTVKDLVAPLEAILVPIFFLLIGMQVKLETFMEAQVLKLSAALLVAAIAGKLITGLVTSKKESGWIVGIGMMPRGEVGLVFATIGRSLSVINDDLYSAIILTVILTTLLAPPLLKVAAKR